MFAPLVPTFCHTATVIWAYRELRGGDPSADLLVATLNPDQTLQDMIRDPKVVPLDRPKHGPLQLTPGWVVVFVRQDNDAPGHSCTAIDAMTVGGYNQTKWFTSDGKACDYSVHTTDAVKWTSKGILLSKKYTGTVSRTDSSGRVYNLVAVPERVALSVVEHRLK
jgi:hypothetical protein